MAFFLNLFSVETWNAFLSEDAKVTGFTKNQLTQAQGAVACGDIFLCYLVGLGRWCGALKIESDAFVDDTPIFKSTNDPFVVRFHVTPIIILDPELALPVREPHIWNCLTWTRDITPGSVGWGANFQRSLRQILDDDGEILLGLLEQQASNRAIYELSAKDRRTLNKATTVRTEAGEITVEIPEDEENSESQKLNGREPQEARESHEIQGLIAQIGQQMGFRIWLPKADRESVFSASSSVSSELIIESLPMNYNDATIRTIEQIDVLWLRGRSIARAFEIEHTTAIYSGLLRMADLIALQPDINIPLHIVAPAERQSLVLDQIKRPVFSLFETGPLSDRCSLLTYSDIREIASKPDLGHMRDTILEEYQVQAQ